MFKILDGRDSFYQWDVNREVIVEDDSITEVHFCNRTDDCSLVVKVIDSDGMRIAEVPNILLQEYWDIYVYGYDEEYTKHCDVFKVNRRTKPEGYIYTETEVLNYSDLDERLEYLETNGIPDVPTNVSAFLNDAGYLTEHQSLEGYATEDYVDKAVDNIVIPEPDLSGYALKSEIPDVSAFLTADDVSGFQTEEQVKPLIDAAIPPSGEDVSY